MKYGATDSTNPMCDQPSTMEMISIPAHTFWMGEGEDRHEVTLSAYHIGKYPVTAVFYQTFIDATNHPPPPHWPNGRHHPMLSDHPVVNISWIDALAFCSWLSEQAQASYRLPTEAEWEFTARGTKGNIYPWGDTYLKENCNTWEAVTGQTTPVDAFPEGASPFGVMDMSGNVWEWCSTILLDYPYQADDAHENLNDKNAWRVLRGGSWYDANWGVRAARRLGSPAHYISHNTGFRVASTNGRN